MVTSNIDQFDRWTHALLQAPTAGASAATASQDNLPAGVASSQQMAKTDLFRVQAIVDRLRQVGKNMIFRPLFLPH